MRFTMKNYLNITEASNIAIHALVCLNILGKDKPMSNSNIAAILEVSESHLAKIMQKLVRGGFIGSQRGVKGGHRLIKSAADISLDSIIESIEGRKAALPCLFHDSRCENGHCQISQLEQRISADITKQLQECNIGDFKVKFKNLDKLR
jgi:Rrf2 family protein